MIYPVNSNLIIGLDWIFVGTYSPSSGSVYLKISNLLTDVFLSKDFGMVHSIKLNRKIVHLPLNIH